MSMRLGWSLFFVISMAACGVQMGEAVDEEGDTANSRQAAEVPATAATVNGTCARLEEVEMEFADYATFKEAGGWSTFNPSGALRKSWHAVSRQSCNTFPTDGSNKNKVICYYRTDNGPQLGASKTFPTAYDCTCNSSDGKYRCIRQ